MSWKARPRWRPVGLEPRPVLRHAGDDRTRGRGRGEQRRRLGVDHRHVVRLADGQVLGPGELPHLSLRDRRRGAGEHVERLQRADVDHQLERLSEQEIADQHARLVAPDHPRRRLAAPHVAVVHHIVVQQRRCVHVLDGRRELDVTVAAIVEQLCGREGQHRSDALAAGRDQMVGDLRDHRHIRAGVFEDQGVDLLHAIGDASHQPINVCGGRRRCLCVRDHGSRLEEACMGRTIGVLRDGGKRHDAACLARRPIGAHPRAATRVRIAEARRWTN